MEILEKIKKIEEDLKSNTAIFFTTKDTDKYYYISSKFFIFFWKKPDTFIFYINIELFTESLNNINIILDILYKNDIINNKKIRLDLFYVDSEGKISTGNSSITEFADDLFMKMSILGYNDMGEA